MRGKKAMSPLIATVLLIAFAVALGAMIMNWSAEEVSAQTDPNSPVSGDPCVSVGLEVQEAFGEKALCHKDGELRFNVVNSGKVEIKGLQLRTLDGSLKEVKEIIPSSQLAVGGTFSYTTQLTDTSKLHVELVPYIIVNNNQQFCIKKAVIQDILPQCSQ